MTSDPAVRSVAVPDAADVHAVLALSDAAEEQDGVAPLNEASRLRLKSPADAGDATHLLAETADGTLRGYAQLAGAGTPDAEVELVVHPAARRTSVGRSLLREVVGLADGRLRGWAHGNLPGARALAAAEGFEPVRGLWRMRLDLSHPLPDLVLPEDVHLRSFVPGQDEDAWLAVNARAFATHPEQGRWTAQDLAARQREPWFDPDGFLLADDARTGELLGYHWTKVEDGVGEVYVVGVDPSAQGRRLGSTLTLAGLHHLAGQGVEVVDLYVESDNAPALAVYQRLGFVQASVDVMYALPHP